ncbi:MAG: hypothetical protein M1825_002089 [Sarcosagium campestre]|nr:MAG: hypothetical protein M1825_002089 [Sarcosagium campestre]
MCLLDTTDGALMMTLYTSTALARDQIAILYYSIVLTAITVIVALVIGIIQLLSLVLNVAEPSGRFWDGVASAGDHYDIIAFFPAIQGGAICASFVVFFAISVLFYRPWRRRIDRCRAVLAMLEQPTGNDGSGDNEERQESGGLDGAVERMTSSDALTSRS